MTEDNNEEELTSDCYELLIMDESGHTSYTYPAIETDFANSMGIGDSRVDGEIPVELNKELPVWVKIGTDKNSMRVLDITEDFRNSDCNAGIAITLFQTMVDGSLALYNVENNQEV